MAVTEEKMLLTQEGWRRLHEELAALRKQRDLEMGEHRQAGHSGDWVESAVQYMSSDAVALGRRVAQLEKVLLRSTPVGPANREQGKIGVGSKVVVRWDDGGQDNFLLVGPPEVDIATGRISYEAPVGCALMGRQVGEWVEVISPDGPSQLQIIAVI